jgi:hypothetical protein
MDTYNMLNGSSWIEENRYADDHAGKHANSLFRKILRVSRLASRFYADHVHSRMPNCPAMKTLAFSQKKMWPIWMRHNRNAPIFATNQLCRNFGSSTRYMLNRSSRKTKNPASIRMKNNANSLFRKILHISPLMSRFYASPAQPHACNYFRMNTLAFFAEKNRGGL